MIYRIQWILKILQFFEIRCLIFLTFECKLFDKFFMCGFFVMYKRWFWPNMVWKRFIAHPLWRFPESFCDDNSVLFICSNTNTDFVPWQSPWVGTIFIQNPVPGHHAIISFIKPNFVGKNNTILVRIKQQEQFFQSIPWCLECIFIVPRICVDGNISKDIHAILYPFTYGYPVFIKNRSCGRKKCLMAFCIVALVPLDTNPCLSILVEWHASTMWTFCRRKWVD